MTRVWDPMVRIFHWSLVVFYTLAWISAEAWDGFHEAVGYIAAGLIAFRLIWGIIGSRYARFSQFVKGPAAVKSYLKSMLRGRENRYLGHNPAGAAMIIVLLIAIGGTAWTGWLITLPNYAKSDLLSGAHEVLASGTLFFIALHVGGVLVASLRHRENLVRSMVTGDKREPGPNDIT